MKVLVVGPGAIGLLFGTRLKKAGAEVTYLTRSPESAQELTGGVTLRDRTLLKDRPEVIHELKGKILFDYVFITLKAHKIKEAVPKLRNAEFNAILVLSNGMGYEDLFNPFRPKTLFGVTEMGATRLSRREVLLRGEGITYIENKPGISREIQKLLEDAGFKVKIADDIESVRFGKLLLNAIINPLTALAGVKNGEILKNEFLKEFALKLVHENEMLANRLHIKLPYPSLKEKLIQILKNTAENESSMLQDIKARKKTEIDFINGYLLRRGEEAGVELPLNSALYLLVKALEAKNSLRSN